MRGKCSLISSDLIFPLTICSILLLAFGSIFLARHYTLILLILVERDLTILLEIFLMILISPIFFLLWGYTITIEGNFHSIIEIYSTLSRIRCTSLWFLVTTVSIGYQVLVRCTQLLCLRIEGLQHLFYLTYGRFLWW